ncbi:MAG: site-specific integrase [Bacteroidales bacterium]|jgi:site-specific recombinase XerD|nr:site-specific integrase [Bacteroidales bacterium]
MAKSKLRLDTRRQLKDGTYPVQVAVGYGSNIYLATGIFLTSADWDSRTQRATGRNAKRINAVLDTLLIRVSNRILELRETGRWDNLTGPQLREMLTDLDLESPTVGVPTLGALFDTVIATKTGGTAMLYGQTLKKLTAYCDPYQVRFEKITKLWIDGFYASLDPLAINSRAMHLRNLRNVINYALDENITQNYPFRNYRIPTEETVMRVLPVEKMRQLLALRLSSYDTEYRDMFMLSFYLIGINMVDMAALTKDNIIDGRLEYRRSKTGKFYSIRLEPEAIEIIARYRGKKHLLAPFDRFDRYQDYTAHLNAALRKIGPQKMVNGKPVYTKNHLPVMDPLEAGITWYWARYSWATYAADLDIPKDTISEALGHKYGSSITGVYIKFSRDKIDAANRRVIDWTVKGIK